MCIIYRLRGIWHVLQIMMTSVELAAGEGKIHGEIARTFQIFLLLKVIADNSDLRKYNSRESLSDGFDTGDRCSTGNL